MSAPAVLRAGAGPAGGRFGNASDQGARSGFHPINPADQNSMTPLPFPRWFSLPFCCCNTVPNWSWRGTTLAACWPAVLWNAVPVIVRLSCCCTSPSSYDRRDWVAQFGPSWVTGHLRDASTSAGLGSTQPRCALDYANRLAGRAPGVAQPLLLAAPSKLRVVIAEIIVAPIVLVCGRSRRFQHFEDYRLVHSNPLRRMSDGTGHGKCLVSPTNCHCPSRNVGPDGPTIAVIGGRNP